MVEIQLKRRALCAEVARALNFTWQHHQLPVKACGGEEGEPQDLQPGSPTGAALPVAGALWPAGGVASAGHPPSACLRVLWGMRLTCTRMAGIGAVGGADVTTSVTHTLTFKKKLKKNNSQKLLLNWLLSTAK